ncbi:MAG: OmpA family protein [Eudoraea sp.]
MKSLIVKYFLFFIFISHFGLQIKASDSTSSAEFLITTEPTYINLKGFLATTKKYGIASRKVEGFPKDVSGYYAVAGVFGELQNARRLQKNLKAKNLLANIIYHSNSKLHYVYIYHDVKWENTVKSIVTKFDGRYAEKTWILYANEQSINPVNNSTTDQKSITSTSIELIKSPSIKKDHFLSDAKAKKIPARVIKDLIPIDNGFYLIAGVFGDLDNAHTSINNFKSKGLKPRLFRHPISKLNYVYLSKYTDQDNAFINYQNKLNGQYNGKLWILQIQNKESEAKNVLKTIPQEKNISIINELMKPQAVSKTKKNSESHAFTANDKLLEKANSYFDKMWYSEAAELYELVLEEEGNNAPYQIIERAADAHYYNTNMERAYYWYDILYREYKNEMSADNIFKYAHALKGTGKYARAKRLMRIYDKDISKGEKTNDINEDYNEILLDNILTEKDLFTIANLEEVNSEYSDFSPMFYSDDKVVFASAMDSSVVNTRRYKWNNQPYLDLYVAKINKETQEVRDAIKFSKKINTKYHEASITFSPDNDIMYFTRNNYSKKLRRDKNGVNNLKIYMAKKVDGEWKDIKEVPFNSDNYSTGHPALSPDGKKLYFVSDMPGTIGKTDIFVVDVLGDGQFSEPRNLGPNINTEQKEMFPFINEKKLYFSSDGHVGLGGLDVFEVSYDSLTGFSDVKNVGQPVNSKNDDFSYIVNEDTQEGFFASNRRGGKGDDDIYSFKRLLPEEPNENAIAGVVTQRISGEAMPAAFISLLDENNIKLKEVQTDADGSFVFEDLESTTKYFIRTEADGYFEDISAVLTEDNQLVEMEISMNKLKELIVIEEGIRKLKTEMIFFDFDKYTIRNDASNELDKLVEVMQEYPSMVIKIESHTDSRGKRAYNKYLSDKRAKSTRDYIISKGIEASRIESAIGYGEEKLLNECNGTVRCSSAKHQLNRRSEFIIVKM